MAIQTINIGDIPNDGTGDDLRVAFQKVNSSLQDLDTRITSASIEAENVGAYGEAVYAGRDNNTLQFKTLVAGANVTLTSNTTQVIVDAAGGLDEVLVVSDNGHITVTSQNYLGINGGEVIDTRVSGSNLFIDLASSGIVARDSNPTLTANLEANGNNIANAGLITANSFTGPLSGLVYGVDVRLANSYFDDYWDFGDATQPVLNNIIDYLISTNDVDLGGFVGSEYLDIEIDLGAVAP